MKLWKPKRLLAVLLSVLVVAELVVSVVLSTVAQDNGSNNETKTITRQLIDYTASTVAENIQESAWPEGISKMTETDKYEYDSNFTVDIAEDSEGGKFLKFNMNKYSNVLDTQSYIADRKNGHDLFVKISVPAAYIPYLKDVQVDYLYNFKQSQGSATSKRNQAYYILGISDGVGTTFGKDVRSHHTIAPTNAADVSDNVKINITDMHKLTGASVNSITANTTGYVDSPMWTAEDLNAHTKLDVILLVSAPNVANTNAAKKAGYYFGIKNITITLEGDSVLMDNIDNPDYVDTHIVNFEEGTTLTEIETATGFQSQTRGELVTTDGHSGTNAYLYRRKKDGTGTDYDTRVGVSLNKANSAKSQGVTFMYKNISDGPVSFRIWIAPGNATDIDSVYKYQSKGKYQYTFTAAANMTEYKRVTIYWDNVGLVNYSGGVGGFAGGSSSGTAITQDEINSGFTIRILQNGLSFDDAGVLLDTFEFVTPAFQRERTVDVVNFENSDIGTNDIPSNVSITGTYGGSAEIVDIDGNNGLQLNYDAEQFTFSNSGSDGHHLAKRPYFHVAVSIPKGSLNDVSSITYDVSNNRAQAGKFDRTNGIYTGTAYVLGLSAGEDYGKDAEVRTEVNFTGNTVLTVVPTNLLHTTASNMVGYQNKATAARWTTEEIAEIDTIHLYISAPYTDGTEGESFTINSITFNYNEPPAYIESETREIFQTTKAEPVNGSNLTVTKEEVSPLDPNAAEFGNTYKIEIADGNTEGVVFTNDLGAYNRNFTAFTETAIFHMFSKTEAETELRLVVTDKNGAEMTYTFTVATPKTKLYTETNISMKEVYDAYVAANPDSAFDTSDIRTVVLYANVTEAATIYVAKPEILTGAYVSSAEDTEKLKKTTLVNFDNCEVGSSELPTNVTLGDYTGSTEIVEKEDGTKALRVYYDVPVTVNEYNYSQAHQLVTRTNIALTVTVPTGSLQNLKKINYTVTSNAFDYSDNKLTNTYYVTVLRGGGMYVKGNESAHHYKAEQGVETTHTFDLFARNTLGSTNSSSMLNHMNKSGDIDLTDEHFEGFNQILLYVGVPEVVGTEGYWFEISSIDLEFSEIPAYEEEESRTIADDSKYSNNGSKTVSVTAEKLASNNINYRKFKTAYTIDAKKGNTDSVTVTNGNINFVRHANTFLDSASFRIYTHASKKGTLKLNLVNFNGERLPFEIEYDKNKDSTYNEYIVSLKDIYEDFKENYPDDKFSLYNITAVEVLPDSSSATKLNIAGVSLWTAAPGTGSSAGNYYRATEDGNARIEGYKDAIAETFDTTIEVYEDLVSKISADGIRIPAGTTPVAMVKYTLRNGTGEIAEPSNNFWISIKVPDGIDLNDIGIYRVFLDGSLVKLRHAIEPDRFITANTFFSMDTFVVLSGVYSSVAKDEPEKTEETVTEEKLPEYEYTYEYIPSDDGDEEQTIITTPIQVVRSKKIIKKKNATENNFTWLWILLIIVAVVVVIATGLIIFFIVRKKRKNRKENVTV